ncbi:hypothetical protein KIN20_020931 [Parelaphostrongylus tenuis]|uniref:Uncharacterized protein n=1 Tax=Parelaphostrongylus tenuis TaxID=148309 RepID=A0AAD5MNC4_PARTN|nr:hypothetical protein KIN20_020931 [Parelaphostrongylus tenuis]
MIQTVSDCPSISLEQITFGGHNKIRIGLPQIVTWNHPTPALNRKTSEVEGLYVYPLFLTAAKVASSALSSS